MADERETKQLNGCLLQAGISYPQKAVMVCGPCPNRSDTVGDLGLACLAAPGNQTVEAASE